MTVPRTLGLDIGGATLKAATTDGRAWSIPFPLWKSPERLAEVLAGLIGAIPYDQLAVTMTGELCDCFETKAHGVNHILDAVVACSPDPGRIVVWQSDGNFVTVNEARDDPWKTAASNWLALAQYAARFAEGSNALLVDIGSTTTDIVPISQGVPVPQGRTDPDRLASGELVYAGALRTPLCALVDEVTVRGRTYRTMAELFATTLDVYLMLGKLPEDTADTTTADGRTATQHHARSRLARMIGSDATRFGSGDAVELSEQVDYALRRRLSTAAKRVIERSLAGNIDLVISSGQGEFIIPEIPATKNVPVLSLGSRFDPAVSKAACAYAVGMLAAGL